MHASNLCPSEHFCRVGSYLECENGKNNPWNAWKPVRGQSGAMATRHCLLSDGAHSASFLLMPVAYRPFTMVKNAAPPWQEPEKMGVRT